MNFDQPPKKSWVKVLVWVLVSVGVLIIALIIGAYYAVMHTSLPFKMVEAMLSSEDGSQDFKVEGISGSIAKGFVIRRIYWTGTDGGESEIKDVRVAYSGFWDLIGGKRIVFKEIHIGKAHLDVTGIEEMAAEMDGSNGRHGRRSFGEPDASVWTNSPLWATNAAFRRRAAQRQAGRQAGGAPDLFEIDRISVEDVFITNRATGFGLSMPGVEWKGFKALKGNVELGQLTIDSDRLKVETHDGETAEVNGNSVAFQKKLEGTILPRLHKSVLRPIAFTIDAAYIGGGMVWRLKAFEGKLEAYRGSDRAGYLRCKDVDLGSYFDGAIPEHLTMESKTTRKNEKDLVKVGKGTFKMGMNWFEIQPAEWESAEDETRTNKLTATGRTATGVLKYELDLPARFWNATQSLKAEPELTPDETLARLYFGKGFGELNEEQQTMIKKKRGGFSDWEEESAAPPAPKAKVRKQQPKVESEEK